MYQRPDVGIIRFEILSTDKDFEIGLGGHLRFSLGQF